MAVLISVPIAASPQERLLQFSDRFEIDKSKFSSHDVAKPFYFYMRDPDGGLYNFTVDIGTKFEVELSPEIPSAGDAAHKRSLALGITSDVTENLKDKIFFDLLDHKSPDAIDIESHRSPLYISYDFKLDKNYEVPIAWAMHMQVWQCCGGHPPFSLHVLPGKDKMGPIILSAQATNDSEEEKHYGEYSDLVNFEVKRNVWYNLRARFDPRYVGSDRSGCITLWLDKKMIADVKMQWGYRPSTMSFVSVNAGQVISSKMQIDLGVYRRRQKTFQKIYIDNIRTFGIAEPSDVNGSNYTDNTKACSAP